MSQDPSSEAEALALLERAARLAAGRATREAVALLAHDVDEGEDHASADAQNELAWALVAWAERLEREVRAREAHAFYAAALSLPKGPREDPELLAATLRSARALGLERDMARYRAALLRVAPDHLDLLAEPAKVEAAAPNEAPEHYKHPKFGVGVLLRREISGLRIRFESGERVIAVGRVERV